MDQSAAQWRFERDEQRRKRIAENALAHGAVVDVRGEAPAAFDEAVLHSGGVDGVPRPSAIFYRRWPDPTWTARGVLRAAAARRRGWSPTLSPPNPKQSSLSGIPASAESFDAFQHYRGEPVGGFTGWRPAMPVTQWSVMKP